MTHMNTLLPANERAKLLLDQLSLEEKIFQLASTIYVGEDHKDRETRLPYGIGQVAIYAGLPTKEENKQFIIKLQKEIMDQSRFDIPAIFHIEALSGGVMADTLTFPTAIGLGATFDDASVKKMAHVVSTDLQAVGLRQTLSPVLDVATDYRWGRISETFGEDPTLIAGIGCAYVEGFQGDDLKDGVACTAKHFLGYGASEGALNMANTILTETQIQEIYAKPFEAAIRQSDIKSVMNSYASINGEPIVSSQKIMKDLLRDQMGFDGLTVTDYSSITRLPQVFKTANDNTAAAIQCIKAGIDVECPAPIAYMGLINAVKEGKLEEKYVDESVIRSLTLKFELGLFENPLPMDDYDAFNQDDLELALSIAKETLTLTKNEGLLPLSKDQKNIAVIGPCAHSLRSYYSTYSFGGMLEILDLKKENKDMDMAIAGVSDTMTAIRQPDIDDERIEALLRKQYPEAKTVFESLLVEETLNVSYNKGCHVKNDETSIDEAVALAKENDVVVMAVGERNGWGFACTTGEGVDSTEITLTGHQLELIKSVHQVNPNIVLLHFGGHPIVDGYIYEHIPSIVECWLPGQSGGEAIKEVLLGKYSPSGRLPITIPRDVGQTPSYHYQYNGSGYKALALGGVNPDGYINTTAKPRRPFGYGLSYTNFEYSDFNTVLNQDNDYPIATLSVVVENTGDMAADEVVQVYGSHLVAKRIRPNQELLGYKRLHLAVNETKKISFEVNMTQFAYFDDGEWLLEKGDFKVWIGKHSDEIVASDTVTVDESYDVKREDRTFFAKSIVV